MLLPTVRLTGVLAVSTLVAAAALGVLSASSLLISCAREPGAPSGLDAALELPHAIRTACSETFRNTEPLEGRGAALLALLPPSMGIVWAARRRRSRTEIPVAVAPLRNVVAATSGTAKDGTDGEVTGRHEQLTAMIEQRLTDTRLPHPPSAPISTTLPSFSTVVAAGPIPHAKWLAAVYEFVAGLYPNRYLVEGICVDRGNSGIDLTTWMTRRRKVVFTHQVRAATADEAAKAAAYALKHEIISHQRFTRSTPAWTHWRADAGTSLRAFARGRGMEENGRLDAALDEYHEVARQEPGNVPVRLQIANLYVRDEQYLSALKCYLNILRLWPEIIEARYRLAAICSFADVWKRCSIDDDRRLVLPPRDGRKPDLDVGPARTDRIARDELARMFQLLWSGKGDRAGRELREEAREQLETFANCGKSELPEAFLRLALVGWKDLRQRFTITAMAREWLATYEPWRWKPGLRMYLASWANKRYGVAEALDVAIACSKYRLWQLLQPVGDNDGVEQMKAMDRRLQGRGIGWQARYNGACFYSLAMSRPDDSLAFEDWQADEGVRDLVHKALQQLGKVVRNPESKLDVDWLRLDPELEALRNHPDTVAWLEFIGVRAIAFEETVREQLCERLAEKCKLETLIPHVAVTRSGDGHIDGLGLDADGRPVVVAYRRSKDDDVVARGLSDVRWVGRRPRQVRDLLGGGQNGRQVHWERPRLVCVAGEFPLDAEASLESVPYEAALYRCHRYWDTDLRLEPAGTPDDRGGLLQRAEVQPHGRDGDDQQQ